MKVLVACEYSGRVRDAFIKKGHDAISCDLLPTDAPGAHHQGDVIEYLNSFEDGYFDLIIAHPECTKLCVSGNAHYGEGQPKYQARLDSVKWTMMFWELAKKKAKRVCFENPVGVLHRLGGIPKAAYVQPSRRPTDGRYGENPNRLQHYYQFQVVMKPSPLDIQEKYLECLKVIGICLLYTSPSPRDS